MKKELSRRWQTAMIALPLLFLVIYGSISFLILVTLAALICLYEFYSISLTEVSIFHEALIVAYILTPLWLLLLYTGYPEYLWMIATLNLMIMAGIVVIRFRDQTGILDIVTRQTLGFLYIPGLVGFMLLIHQFENGHKWIYVTFMMVFACDTGGYFIGKQFGKHALCPAVSPKKTIEGFLGGLFLCVLTCLFFAILLHLPISMAHMIGLSTVVGIVAPLGDLFESAFKRVSNIKDSGNLLPGHGGLLDRIDALLFSGPLIYGYKTFLIV